MSAQFMRRNIRISVRLTEEEHRLLKEKMARIGVTNQEAFLRKMALDGLVIRLDLPELKQMISLLRYTSNNINQIAKRLNESGRANAPSSKRRGLVRVSAWCLLAPKDLACQLRYDYYDKNPPFFQTKRLLKNFF